MHPRLRTALLCPVCGEPFRGSEAVALSCAQGHSFDLSKNGTAHLLPAGHGMTRRVGDDDDMVKARTAFFAKGHYLPLSHAIADATAFARRSVVSAIDVLDVGCGDGSHLSAVLNVLPSDALAVGVDLSKDAIKHAAKRERRAAFIVGDAEKLPVQSAAIAVAVVAFAPRRASELSRVVVEGGGLVVAIPEKGHLKELVEMDGGIGLHDDKRQTLVEELSPWCTVAHEVLVDEPLVLDACDTSLALRMTPHGRHTATTETSALTTRLRARVIRFVRWA